MYPVIKSPSECAITSSADLFEKVPENADRSPTAKLFKILVFWAIH